MRYEIKKILLIITAIALLLPSAYVALHTAENANEAKKSAEVEFDKITHKTLKIHIDDAMRVCQIMQRINQTAFESAKTSLEQKLSSFGAAQTGSHYAWINSYQQSTPTNVQYFEIPIIAFGENPITPKKDKKDNAIANSDNISSTIAKIKNDTLVDVSILTKINETGALLRLATTLSDEENRLMIASTLDDNDEASEIVRTILARKSYYGIVRIGKNRHIAVYEPILDKYGEVIGAIEILKNFADLEYVFDNFENIRLNEDGYLWGIQIEGSNAVSLKFFRDTKENANLDNDLTNLKFLGLDISEVVDLALSSGENKIVTRASSTFTSGAEREKITAFTYFKPWNIIIGATIYKDNFSEGLKKTEAKIESLTAMIFPILAIASAIAFAFAVSFSRRIIETISRLSRSFLMMQNFNEKAAIKELSSKNTYFAPIAETEQTRKLMLKTAKNISRLVGSITAKTSKLSQASAEMFEKSEHIEKISETKVSKLNDIQSSLTSISKTAESLHEDSYDAAEGIKISISEMKEGASLLGSLEENAQTLISDSQNVELQLSIIKDKADKIANVVENIKTVSERINMLAVNASIEAERAGESAGGFKDVANEISKLSDTTTVSVMHISEMAQSMLKSVNSGVNEMKDFSLIMRGCKESVKNVRDSVSVARTTTLELTPQFDALSSGIDTHADTISGIEKNLAKLSEKSSECKIKSSELRSRTSTVNATSAAIKLKLKNFSLDEF